MTEAEELELLELEKEKSMSQGPSAKDEKPMMRGLLPEAMGGLFPTQNEAEAMRAKQGIPIVPPEPVPEYSPEEEVALGSIAGPQAFRAAAPVVANAARGAAGLMKGAAKAAMKSRTGRLGISTGLGGAMWEGGRRIIRGLMD